MNAQRMQTASHETIDSMVEVDTSTRKVFALICVTCIRVCSIVDRVGPDLSKCRFSRRDQYDSRWRAQSGGHDCRYLYRHIGCYSWLRVNQERDIYAP